MLKPENHKEQIERTKKAWQEKYGFEIKFENEWLRNDTQEVGEYFKHKSQDSGIEEIDNYVNTLLDSFREVICVEDLRSDIEWQCKVAETHFKRKEDLVDVSLYKKYFKNYEKFLYICAKYPSKIVGLGAAHDVKYLYFIFILLF